MSAEQEVLRAALERSAALVRGDAAGLRRFLAEGFVYTNASGAVMDEEEYLETYVTSGDARWESQVLENPQVRLFGHTAVLTATVHDRMSYGGRAFDTRFQTTQVYVKGDDGWRCVAAHTGPAPEGL